MNNDVRQILMNELGLTRETIRIEAKELIENCIAKHIATGALNRIVESVVIKRLAEVVKGKQNMWGYSHMDAIDTLIHQEVKRQIDAAVKTVIKETIKIKVEMINKEEVQ